MDDLRLKTDIRVIADALQRLAALEGCEYRHAPEAARFGFADGDELHVGLHAQDVACVVPDGVALAPFDVDRRRGAGESISGKHYLIVRYDKIVPLLVEAVKALAARVDILEQKSK
jgi:hypothetical protein